MRPRRIYDSLDLKRCLYNLMFLFTYLLTYLLTYLPVVVVRTAEGNSATPPCISAVSWDLAIAGLWGGIYDG